MTDSSPGAPAPIFEGSEKRLELHFSFCHPKANSRDTTPQDTRGLRGLSRTTLDELMTLAACEILSSTSNSTFDAYVLSESSLFVYPTSWVLKTCGNTRPLACLQELLSIASQRSMKPAYVKYSHASYLHPLLQPAEYQCFPDEVAVLRKHVGHLGNGGSAYQLGDSLYGLQWHVFVVSQPSFVPTVSQPSDCGMTHAENESGNELHCDLSPDTPTGTEASVETVPEAPLKTLEVCMTELDVEASQQFVRTPSFVSSAQTTLETGINMLLPGAQLDDHMFEPCGYSMNGIKGSQHITMHVTPEENFSYASCEIHGFTDASVDPSATVASLTSIFTPGRFVATYATTSTSITEPPPYISLAGYCCVGASCQDLPAGGTVYFFSFVKDTFRAAQSMKGCPAALKSFPSFCMLSVAATSGVERNMELAESSQKVPMEGSRKLGSCGTDSSASDMDVQDPEDCCDGGGSGRVSILSTRVDRAKLTPVQHACELIEASSPSDTFFLLDLRALSANLTAWKAMLPSVTLVHNVHDCDDSAVLRHMHEHGACFLAESIAHVEALSGAGIAMTAVVANVHRWRSRELLRAVALGVWRFRVASLSELEMLQRYSRAPGSSHFEVHIVISSSTKTSKLLNAVTEDQASAVSGVNVSGVVLDLADNNKSHAHDRTLDAAQSVCGSLKAAGHSVQSVAFVGVEGDRVQAANLLASQHAWLGGFKASIDCHGLMHDVLMMLSCVLSLDTTEKRVHVTDVPCVRLGQDSLGQNATVELLCMPKHSQDTQISDAKVTEQHTIADGATTAVFALPTDVCSCGDWLVWRGCTAVDVQSSFWAVDRYYL